MVPEGIRSVVCLIKGGKGGAKTRSGLLFEGQRNLAVALSALPNYAVQGNKILHNGEEVGFLLKKKQLYREFLVPNKVPVDMLLSRGLEPDHAVIVPNKKQVTILEIKYQNTEGSVDEKLQTCDFKIRQYRKLFDPLGYKVHYAYVLGDWFLQPRYKDVLNYITMVGCEYYFGEVPLKALGLPE
jgi:hypothetical protein